MSEHGQRPPLLLRPRPGVGAVALVTLAAAAAALIAGVAAGPPPTPAFINSAAPRLPQARRATVPLGARPSDVAAGASAVWVATADAVLRRDPADGADEGRIALPRSAGRRLAVGAGAVWASDPARGSVARIDPRRGVVTATIRVGGNPVALAADDRFAWVLRWRGASATVLRIDARSARIAGRWQLGGLAFRPLLVAAGGAAWTVDAGALVRVGPGRTVRRRAFLGTGSIAGLARLGHTIWVSLGSGRNVGELIAADTRGGEPRRMLVGQGAVGPLAVEGGGIWVVSGVQGPGARAVAVADPRRRRMLAASAAPSSVSGMAAGFGSVWTADVGARALSRFSLPRGTRP